MDYLKLFQSLPNLNLERQIVINDSYNPTLYKWDGHWLVSWIGDEGDSVLEITGETPEDTIMKAVNYISVNYNIKIQ